MPDGTEEKGPYAEALAFLDEGRTAKAVDRLRWAGRSLDPLAYDEAWAEVELDRGDYGAAAGLAERTLAAGRETARLHEIAALALWWLGTHAEARSHAERTGEGTVRLALLRARMALPSGDFAEAERWAARAHAMRPDWTDAEAMLYAARMAGGDPGARVALRLLWERTKNAGALEHLLTDGNRRRDPSVADGLFAEVLAAGALDGTTLAQAMWARSLQRDWNGMIAAFDAAPENVRDTAYCLRMRGVAETGKGEHAAAAAWLERAYAKEPTSEWTVNHLFKALGRSGRWLRAIRLVREHNKARKAAGIRESTVRDFIRNLRSRGRRRR